jgi:hypothetical protein
MRPGLIDESKIIKKDDQKKDIIEEKELPKLQEGEKINCNPPAIGYINKDAIAKLEINTTDISNNKSDIVSDTIPEKPKIIKSQPVFIFERDKETKKVKTVSAVQNKTMNFDISNDYLPLIYSNTLRQINEIKFDIEILNLMISEKDNYYFNDKLTILMQELEFNNRKLEVLEQLINK